MERHSRGLTLLELMVTVAVLGVVLGMGVPAFRRVSAAVWADGAFHDLTTTLGMARSVAISRGATIVVCPSQDRVNCRQDGVWDEGWITFQARGRRSHSTGSFDLVQMHPPSSGRELVIRSNRPRARFQPSGRSEGSNFTLCIYRGAAGPLIGRIAVNRAGRIHSERTSFADACGDSP